MKHIRLIVVIIGWLFNTGAAAPEKMTMFKVTEGVYFMENSRGSGNSSFVVTNDGVVVFDFHLANADQTLAAIRQGPAKRSVISSLRTAPATMRQAPGISARTSPFTSRQKIRLKICSSRKAENLRDAKSPMTHVMTLRKKIASST